MYGWADDAFNVLERLTRPAQTSVIPVIMLGSGAEALVHCRAGGPALQGLVEFDLVLHRPGEHPRGALCPARALFGPARGHAYGGGAQPQLWLWLHPAAYAEALAALRDACAASAVDILPRCARVPAE